MLPSKGCEKSKVGPACTLPIVFFFLSCVCGRASEGQGAGVGGVIQLRLFGQAR